MNVCKFIYREKLYGENYIEIVYIKDTKDIFKFLSRTQID